METLMKLKNILIILLFSTTVLSSAELPTEDPPQTIIHPLLKSVIDGGPYEAQWESLITHPIPSWFTQNKIGLSAHWGPYSVPGWTPRKDTPYGVAYAEWYWNWLKGRNRKVVKHHKKLYKKAIYDDFFDGVLNRETGKIDGFFTENFDADRWMKTFKDAGVKYFFITSKHHDGYCLWDTKYTDRNSFKTGPKRDLLAELVTAARNNGIKIGFYYSFYEWYNPIYENKKDINHYTGIKQLQDEDGDGDSTEYVDDFMVPQIKELIDKFHPDYLCFDGEWDHGYTYWRSRQILAYYYNQAAQRGQEVIMNDRFGQKKDNVSDTRGVYGDFFHVEYNADIDKSKPWAMWRGFGNSFGYNSNEHPDNILTIDETIEMMVDIVSDNGNVEFNLGPKSDGTLPEFELKLLAAMGTWLQANGTAIYNTEKSPLERPDNGQFTHNPESNLIFYHIYNWPESGTITVKGIHNQIKTAYLLENNQNIEIKSKSDSELILTLPLKAVNQYVNVIAIEYEGQLRTSN